MYVKKEDYKNRIAPELLEQIIIDADNNGDDILATASKIAEDTIDSTAGVLYDFTEEFAKEGTDRNHLVLQWALSLAVYEIYQRIPDEEVPKKIIKNHDDTLTSLENCSKGKYPIKLPPRTEDQPETTGNAEEVTTTGIGLRRIGSQPKRTHMPS